MADTSKTEFIWECYNGKCIMTDRQRSKSKTFIQPSLDRWNTDRTKNNNQTTTSFILKTFLRCIHWYVLSYRKLYLQHLIFYVSVSGTKFCPGCIPFYFKVNVTRKQTVYEFKYYFFLCIVCLVYSLHAVIKLVSQFCFMRLILLSKFTTWIISCR